MLINKYIIVTAILFFAASCSDTRDNTELENHKKVNLIVNKQAFEKAENNRKNSTGHELSDPFNIESIERVEDILKVKVSYSGGCKEHTFEVIYGGQILLSNPCQINLILTQDAKDDPCEANLTETLEIDLNKLVGDNQYKDACTYNVFNVLNASSDPDGVVTSLDN